jgi:NADPH:quinone reductase-like Zn-dependent oxidoreductase
MAFAYQMTAPGAESVQRNDVEARPPGSNEVQIRMRATSLNYHDLVALSGFMPHIAYPRVPMSDGVGEIVALGEGVSDLAVGDRVIPNFCPDWLDGRPTAQKKKRVLGETTDGCLQELLTIEANCVVKAPAHMTDLEAATLPCAGHTAWYAMMEEGALQAGQTVLVQGTGGVALLGLQMAKAAGARVVITSSSDEKLERARALGADIGINYTEHPDWEKQVLAKAGQVDVVLDLGGQQTLGKSVHCTRDDGTVAVIGVLSGFDAALVSVIEVMQKNITLKGITVGCAESHRRMNAFLEQHRIQPVISHQFNAGELAGAVEVMTAGGHFGKIALTVD